MHRTTWSNWKTNLQLEDCAFCWFLPLFKDFWEKVEQFVNQNLGVSRFDSPGFAFCEDFLTTMFGNKVVTNCESKLR